ncbi:hypothetical protein IWQ62_003781 [Dispira parvispora]|uniref:Superoxide dismutase copper/zinc binding domain-containing protein n=1 Tax=Dispira parvispora TaxID=1520584 RepID=A0A9W8AM86_9FUNG|nr:hypothetical protein IWQ62_003781 [Dispira parvispora]
MVKLAIFACIATAILATCTLGATTQVRRSSKLVRRNLPAGIATFNGGPNNEPTGDVTLTTTADGVEISINLNGLLINYDYHLAIYEDDVDSPNPCAYIDDIYDPCDVDNGNGYQCIQAQALTTCKAGDVSGRFGTLATDNHGSIGGTEVMLNSDVGRCVNSEPGNVLAVGIREMAGPLVACAILQ